MKIYVACPPRTVTGGVELLHQLCHELNSHIGVFAYIWYPFDTDTEIPKVYADAYKNETGCPTRGDVVIYPEIWAHIANEENGFKKVIYWESVDNAPKGLKLKDDILHLAQSHYAYDYLKNGLKIPHSRRILLTDYINNKFIRLSESEERLRVVLYNPAKGLKFTKKIMECMPDVPFIPLSGMTTEEMIDEMRHSMVYIDFGNHPGKDRIPREAAVSGCCVITGRNGSANYREDVPIPDTYKFERCEMQLPMICNRIRDIFENYDERKADFVHYISSIIEEHGEFRMGVCELVERLKS